MNLRAFRYLFLIIFSFFSLNLSAATIPMEAWIHDPMIDRVAVNPSGNKLSAITLRDINQAPELTLWDTADLSKPPIRKKPRDSKVLDAIWLNDDTLLAIGRKKFDIRVGGKPIRTFRTVLYVTKANKESKFRELLRHRDDVVRFSIKNITLHNSKSFLAEAILDNGTTEIFEFNLNNYSGKRIFRGGDRSGFETSNLGKVRVKTQLENKGRKDVYISYSLRNKSLGPWEEHFKTYAKDREGVGFNAIYILPDDSIYVLDNKGRDKTVVRQYDMKKRAMSEPVFENKNYDIDGLVFDRFRVDGKSDLIGYVVGSPQRHIVYTSPKYKSLMARINQVLPSRPDQQNFIDSISRDGSMVVIRTSGDRDAGSFYLLVNGSQLLALGKRFPHLKSEQLADMEYVSYKARDGLEIPAFLTKPSQGTAPYPTIILPHGGPWARDYLGWDRWAQFLANRGYAVLQPQYRGSQGWGQKLWRAGDREWGQKMQDDKDDGASWLIEQGITEKSRLAMFGYSYGGYAAMAAVVRPNSPYQCAIAGAGLAELDSFDKATYDNLFQRYYQNPTIAGMSPQYNIKKANIPLFLFHGDRDQIVKVDQSRKYYKALKSAGKKVKYLEIPDLWHSNPWFPQHHLSMLTSLEDYLATECGPGGL